MQEIFLIIYLSIVLMMPVLIATALLMILLSLISLIKGW